MSDYRRNPAKNIDFGQKTKNLSTQRLTKINDFKNAEKHPPLKRTPSLGGQWNFLVRTGH